MSATKTLKINWRLALLPLSFILIFVAYVFFRVPVYLLFIFSLWIPIYYFIYPWFLRRRWEDFNLRFNHLYQKESYGELLSMYRREWFLRKFAPQGEMLGKLGLIYMALKKYREAEMVFERAIKYQPAGARDRLYVNLGHVKLKLGKELEARQAYQKVSEGSPYHHALGLALQGDIMEEIPLTTPQVAPIPEGVQISKMPEHLRKRDPNQS